MASKETKEGLPPYKTLKLGIWEVLIVDGKAPRLSPSSWSLEKWQGPFSAYRMKLFMRLGLDVYKIAPGLTIAYFFHSLWGGFRGALSLYASNRLLTVVSVFSQVNEDH